MSVIPLVSMNYKTVLTDNTIMTIQKSLIKTNHVKLSNIVYKGQKLQSPFSNERTFRMIFWEWFFVRSLVTKAKWLHQLVTMNWKINERCSTVLHIQKRNSKNHWIWWYMNQKNTSTKIFQLPIRYHLPKAFFLYRDQLEIQLN